FADLLLSGRSIHRDDALAFALVRYACDADDAPTCFREGALLTRERGTPADRNRALEAFSRGCAGGEVDSSAALDRLTGTTNWSPPIRCPVRYRTAEGVEIDRSNDPLVGTWRGVFYFPNPNAETVTWRQVELHIAAKTSSSDLVGTIDTHVW